MKRRTAAVDRLLALIAGLALTAAGASLIAWRRHIGPVRRFFARADRDFYLHAPQQSWWDFAVAGSAVLAFGAGLWLLCANLRPNRYTTIQLGRSTEHETTTVAAAQVGSAMAELLARDPAVHAASASPVIDRGRPTLRLTVTAEPVVPIARVRTVVAAALSDMEFALGGARMATQVFVRFLPVAPAGSESVAGPDWADQEQPQAPSV